MGWLFDRAMEFGVVTPGNPTHPKHGLIDQDAIVIDVGAATAFWFERFDEGTNWGDLPCFTPGVAHLFLETVAPPRRRFGDGFTPNWPYAPRWGVALHATDLWEGGPGPEADRLAEALAALNAIERLRPDATLSTALDEPRWLTAFHLVTDEGPRRPSKLLATGTLLVRPDGALARVANDDPDECPLGVRIAVAPAAGPRAAAAMLLGPLMFAQALMQAETEFGGGTILPPTDQERRRAKQAGANATARPAVLRSKPLFARLRAAGADEPGGLMRARHHERALFQAVEDQPAA